MILPMVSAGVGLKWDKESVMVDENQRNCISYSVYNPWPEESYIQLELSNDELKDVLIEQEAETKLVPSNTFHNDAIPVEFCFKVPKVYKKDCLLLFLLCKQECQEEQKVYSGKVIAKTVPPPNQMGGSATTAAISAPLNVRVTCKAFERNYIPL